MGGTTILRGAAACLGVGAICLLSACMGTSVAAARPLTGTYAAGLSNVQVARHHRHSRRRARAAWDLKWSATAPCPGADTPASSASASEMTAAVGCLINQERLRFGLPPMDVSTDLGRSAQSWTDQMVATGDFTHGSDTAFSKRLLAAGFNWGEAGENIATGYLTPRDAVAGWMASPDHCQNVLDPDYREMGTGENPAPVGSFASGAATWTQDLGLLMSQNPLSHNYSPQNGCPYTIATSPGA
jgi:uncharacterized protein YkwD